jgi:phage tail-like protein
VRRERIAELLPTVIRRALPASRPLDAILGIMESMHAPAEEVLARFAEVVNPYTAAERFVPYLAGWLGLDAALGEQTEHAAAPRVRELVAMSSTLAKWRGTAKGLLLFLEIATGVRGFTIDEPHPFHFVLGAPANAATQRELIERIVAAEKPAYVTCELRFDANR